MSIKKAYLVTCDGGCGKTVAHECPNGEMALKAELVATGCWIDFCPECDRIAPLKDAVNDVVECLRRLAGADCIPLVRKLYGAVDVTEKTISNLAGREP